MEDLEIIELLAEWNSGGERWQARTELAVPETEGDWRLFKKHVFDSLGKVVWDSSGFAIDFHLTLQGQVKRLRGLEALAMRKQLDELGLWYSNRWSTLCVAEVRYGTKGEVTIG